MNYHIDREIRLSEESESKNLYSWSLQEFSSDGNKIGRDLIPWSWTLNFTASELLHHKTIQIEQSRGHEGEVNESRPAEESESISGILHSGICRDGEWLEFDITFSMFGTERKTDSFDLRVYRLEDGDTTESCRLWGCVSHTFEIDFQNSKQDDAVEIQLWLSPARFNDLAEVVKTRKADLVEVSLRGASGMYSVWSPSILTRSVKILTADDDHKVVLPEGCAIAPPRLGPVQKFDLVVTQRSKLNPKQDFKRIDIREFFREEAKGVDVVEGRAQEQPDSNSMLLTQLTRNELAIAKLRAPLWLIFVLLLLLFLKQVL